MAEKITRRKLPLKCGAGEPMHISRLEIGNAAGYGKDKETMREKEERANPEKFLGVMMRSTDGTGEAVSAAVSGIFWHRNLCRDFIEKRCNKNVDI